MCELPFRVVKWIRVQVLALMNLLPSLEVLEPLRVVAWKAGTGTYSELT
jgi:hypothetical protein